MCFGFLYCFLYSLKLFFLSKKENYPELLGMEIQNWTTFITTLAAFFSPLFWVIRNLCCNSNDLLIVAEMGQVNLFFSRKHGQFILGAVPVPVWYRPFHVIIFQKLLMSVCRTLVRICTS